jgi:hypothetical protein
MSSRAAARDDRLQRRAQESGDEPDGHRAGPDPDATRSTVAAEIGAPDQ